MILKYNLSDHYAKYFGPLGNSLRESPKNKYFTDRPSDMNSAQCKNLVEILRHHALVRPDKCIYTFISDGESDEARLTFKELDQQARALASRFKTLIAPGDRALLLYPSSLEYLTAFFGCLYAGVIPVPAFPPRLNRVDQRIEAISNNAQAAIALTTPDILAGVERRSKNVPGLEQIRWLSTRFPEPVDGMDNWVEPDLSPDSLAFIQYTSGSTASPKGVMVSHGNLIHNLSSIQTAFEVDPNANDIGVSWAPLYHDSGLILSALLAVYAGGEIVLMSPAAFAQRPARWLEMITRHKGTISGGPNFALQWCVDRTTPEERAALDLSSWRVAFTGAEPIRSETLKRFIKTFAPCGFRADALTPVYGLAESTLMISSKHQTNIYSKYFLERPALESGRVVEVDPENSMGREFVGCGEPLPDQDVVIVDPDTQTSLPEDRVGEIWVTSPSVAQGYWANPAETRSTFHARLADRDEKNYLRTGDLGFVKYGELIVTGRLKDIIIINGRNYYAEDIELTIRELHPALQADSGAVFSIEKGGVEHLVIVYEVKREYRNASIDEVSRLIRRAIAENHELAVHDIVLIQPLSMPRTTSNKIQRSACKASYLSGSLEKITNHTFTDDLSGATQKGIESSPALPRTPIEASLCFIWAEVLGIDHVGIYDNFFELGGTSLIATQIASRVEDFFQVELSLSILFETPTVANLAILLEKGRLQARQQPEAPILRVDRSLPIPCSFSQERMWFLHQLDPQSSAYNIPIAVKLKGVLNLEALKHSFRLIIDRHEALRTTFICPEDHPFQVFHPAGPMTIDELFEMFDLSGHPIEERESLADQLVADAVRKPFNLGAGYLLRVVLIKIHGDEYILVINMHHIISDAWSINQLVREFLIFYNAFTSGATISLPELPIQYADYTSWQRQRFSNGATEEGLSYWRHQLNQVPILELPADHPRPEVQTYCGAIEVLEIDESLLESLKTFSRKNESTLFMTLLSAYASLLNRYSGQTDLAIGVPVANRNRVETEQLIGVLVNTVVMRLDLNENPTFKQLLNQVRKTALEAYDHQDLPFYKLISELRPVRDPGHTPLAQVLFNLIDVQTPPLIMNDLEIELLQVNRGGAQFDLTLSVTDIPTEKTIAIEYNTDLFEKSTISRMMGHFVQLLSQLVSKPHQPISQISFLSEVEINQLLVDWNDTFRDYPDDICLPDLFEAQVARTPDEIAVSHQNRSLTYRELNQRANQLAHHLRKAGIQRGEQVGLYMRRSPDLLVAMLGVLKAGAAYVPLDPTFPTPRLSYMVNDAEISLMVSEANLDGILTVKDITIVHIDTDWEFIQSESVENPAHSIAPDDLAYVIYTSGSTGKPKGVQINHGAVVNFLLSMVEKPGIDRHDNLLAVTTFSFDIAVLELLLPLVVGAKVVIVDRELAYDGNLLAQVIVEQNITIMQATPVTWELLVDSGWQGMLGLKMLCGGEALRRDLAEELLTKGDELWNMYGPTETTVWSCIEHVTLNDNLISIGRPIANTNIYILDPYLQPVPIGIRGMLFIGGSGLSPGYLNLPDLTEKKFIQHPFIPGTAQRIYMTGDMARYLPDGRIEYLGRNDQQVKIRGFRIELPEVESTITEHPAVKRAVVSQHTFNGQKSLVAYIVFSNPESATVPQLRSFLKQTLPEYMLPVSFMPVASIPLTPNGKVNYKELPTPQITVEDADITPRNFVERNLVRIWEEVLNVRPVRIGSNFFDLGGHSLLAIRLLNNVEKVFGIRLPIATIFQSPTVEEMALVISGKIAPPDWSVVIPIQSHGSQRPLYLVHGAGGGIMGYTALSKALGTDRPFYGLQARGVENQEEPHDRIDDMAAYYIDQIKRIQPTGPYNLAGYSFGGMVAYEMACQLRDQGEHVGLLAILDTYAMSRQTALKLLWHPSNFLKFLVNIPGWIIDQAVLKFNRNSKTSYVPERKHVFEAHIEAIRLYHPRQYDGKVSLFRVRTFSLLRSFDSEFGWGELASGGVDTYIISGSHFNMLEEPFVTRLANELKSSLAIAQAKN